MTEESRPTEADDRPKQRSENVAQYERREGRIIKIKHVGSGTLFIGADPDVLFIQSQQDL